LFFYLCLSIKQLESGRRNYLSKPDLLSDQTKNEVFESKTTTPIWVIWTALALLTLVANTVAQFVSHGANAGLLIWPATGIALAATWHYGPKVILGPALGSAIWAFIFYRNLILSVFAFFITAAGPLLARFVLRRFADWKPVEHALDRMGRLVFVVLALSAPIGATVAVFAAQFIPGDWTSAAHFWLHWWLIDSIGQLLLAPALLGWLGNPGMASKNPLSQPYAINSLGVVGGLLVACFSLMFAWIELPFHASAVCFIFFPLMAWVAINDRSYVFANTILFASLPLLASRSAQVRVIETKAPSVGIVESFSGPNLNANSALDISVLVFTACLVGLLLHAVAIDRRLAVARVARQSREDMSTGLLNDRGLLKDLEEALSRPLRGHYGLIGVHLTNFDSLSDLCGSMQALQLEQSMAELLRRQPQSKMAARMSAGRYAIVVESDSVVNVRSIAREIYVQMTAQSFRTENGSLRLQACVGGLLIDRNVAINSEESVSALADAMAIAASVREPQLFVEPLSQTMIDARRSHQHRIEQVRDAIREQRLELFAQRIVTLKGDQDELSYEVLTRLRHRDGKLMMPPEFIPLTVQAQMSVALDRSVVQKTFEWLGRNRAALNRTSKCSINLSGLTLGDASIASFIFSQRVLNDIPANKIVFEITESEAIRNPAAASRLVDSLKAEGFGIALDDFGTGLATFEYLKRFAIDYLKIDGSFVRTLKANSIDEEIVRATIRVAKHLGVTTVAEHVHQQSVLDLLTGLGIDCIQGALVGMPEPIDQMFEKTGMATH
jgi:EAL domain-containing protein (putative c-di-GMP-specific phosphodiesterase class I)/GGDEF domain-containing protein/integral membrane sensor domain MASE1